MPELLGLEFFRNALIGILIISVASAVIGTYIYTRRLGSYAGRQFWSCSAYPKCNKTLKA